jgi:hypothetical protein
VESFKMQYWEIRSNNYTKLNQVQYKTYFIYR